MSKSNYPSKLDTSVEIPTIRDNITEIGSDVLNSLRSAIFNIERTLGINPQGAPGNTVASRLNNVIDDNGNILKESLDKAGLLSGPISNVDISKVAAISESKLSLDFPTHLLQDQISILDSRLSLFIQSLEELNAILSSHIHPDAINRHFAKAISVESAQVQASSSASKSLEEGTLQSVLQDLYNAHINYTGEGVDSQNNSHTGEQIYYDNQYTSDIISSSSIQGAIDDIAGVQGESLRDSILNLNSNGLIRTGSTYDEREGNDSGAIIVPLSEVSYSDPTGSSKHLIAFVNNPVPTSSISEFDILTISDSANVEDNKSYLIESFVLTVGGELESVTVFDGPKFPAETGTNAVISKSIYTVYNENGLNCSARPRYLKTNTPDIQVANPNAATIISSGIRPSNIKNAESNILSIEVDGVGHEIDLYNSDFDIQNLDSIVFKFNEYSVQNRLNAFAYKVRALKCYELAITHILPNFSEDVKDRTLKITESSSNDASEALGLGYILDREVEGLSGNICHINGKLISVFGNIRKYPASTISINIGTTNIVSTSEDFIKQGIRAGDLCTIEGSTDDSDNGTYRIHSISSDGDTQTLTLDAVGSTFSGSFGDTDACIFIQRCTAPIGELDFLISPLDGLMLIDIFMTDSGEVNFKRRAEMEGHINNINLNAAITDLSKGFITSEQTFKVEVNTDGYAKLIEMPSMLEGDPVFVASSGRYKLMSPDKFNYVILDVNAVGAPTVLESTIVYGGSEVPDHVMLLSRIVFSAKFGFVLGSLSSDKAIPVTVDKRTTGTVDDTIISENLLERYIQGPRNELRGSGVIRDLDIKSVTDKLDGTCRVSVNPGVAVVSGVRVEYLGLEGVNYPYDIHPTSNFYVAIDGRGCLLILPEQEVDGKYISPFFNQNVAHIAYVEVDAGISVTITDLRLFVDNIDYKIIADISVSEDKRFGHFTSVSTAVDYARMFSNMFPKMKAPSIIIKEGEYTIDERISIDFDLKISGAGPQTVLRRGEGLVNYRGPTLDISEGEFENFMFVIGSRDNLSSERIKEGVTFSNMTIKTSTTINDAVGYDPADLESRLTKNAMICITQSITDEAQSDSIFSFHNLSFKGPETLEFTEIEEWPIILVSANYGSETNVSYGNIKIHDCYFSYTGNEKSAIGVVTRGVASNTVKNIVVSNNIFNNISPNQAYSSSGDWVALDIADSPENIGAGPIAAGGGFTISSASLKGIVVTGNSDID